MGDFNINLLVDRNKQFEYSLYSHTLYSLDVLE